MFGWDTFKRALDLSGEVGRLRREVHQLSAEWTDFLEISARREERMRKRESRAVKAQLSEEPSADAVASGGDGRKGDLRARARARGILAAIPKAAGGD